MPKKSSASVLSADAKKMYAESAARSMEDLVSRLKSDKKFASALKKDPRRTLDAAGIKLEKEAMELFIATDPERFDKACDSLFDILDPEFFSKLVPPSCDSRIEQSPSGYRFKAVPRES
jgi:hypothetical protein